MVFQSTLPVWGATALNLRGDGKPFLFQSTLPVWGATIAYLTQPTTMAISIHAPRVGSDKTPSGWVCLDYCISIHAPRVGSDQGFISAVEQSLNFNPRSPCGERPDRELKEKIDTIISIHAPRVGSDQFCRRYRFRFQAFQSTLPVWGATEYHLYRAA